MGERYEVARRGWGGVSGEIRVVEPKDRLGLTWHSGRWPAAAVLLLAVTATPSGKTAIRAHLERHPDVDVRGEVRSRWRVALQRIAVASESGGDVRG